MGWNSDRPTVTIDLEAAVQVRAWLPTWGGGSGGVWFLKKMSASVDGQQCGRKSDRTRPARKPAGTAAGAS